MSKEIRGIVTALTTPFDDSDKIDVPLLQKVVDRNIDAGVDAIVAGGGTGEVAALSTNERISLFESVVQHTAGRVPVVANAGAVTTSQAIHLAQAAERAGADVIMLLSPYYEPLSLAEITRYYQEVAASIALPIMVYNNPGVTGVNLSADTLGEFARNIDNVKYVKDSSRDWEQALRLIHHHGDHIGLICGWDSYSFSAILEGAAGVMVGAANVVPDEIVAVYRSLTAGDIDGAREQWRRVYPVIDALLAIPFTQGVKAGLALQGVPVGKPRSPLNELTAEQHAHLKSALDALNNA